MVLRLSNPVYSINGPVVTVRDTRDFSMMEMVYVGRQRLVGEVIGITDRTTTIQVYEETTGLAPGEPVEGTGAPMSATLGPGILTNIFDGIERPLRKLQEVSGAFIGRGSSVPPLDTERLCHRSARGSAGARRRLRHLPGDAGHSPQVHGAAQSERHGPPDRSRRPPPDQ